MASRLIDVARRPCASESPDGVIAATSSQGRVFSHHYSVARSRRDSVGNVAEYA
jgi:hypothetical protein